MVLRAAFAFRLNIVTLGTACLLRVCWPRKRLCPRVAAVTVVDRQFSVEVSGTPAFGASLHVDNEGDTQLGLGLAVTLIIALIVLIAGGMWWQHDKKREDIAAQRLEKLTLKTARDTNNRIVGYICHELRNPLHVVETWFRVLLGIQVDGGTERRDSDGGGLVEADTMSAEDKATVAQDIGNALAQMRSIVNDVLEYRAVSALSGDAAVISAALLCCMCSCSRWFRLWVFWSHTD